MRIPFVDPPIGRTDYACLDLNEFGDFLAGTFAPLAFLWLVLAVILQSKELGEQRRALLAQLDETRQLTEMQAAELNLSRARSGNEKFRAYLSILRKDLRLVDHHMREDEIDDDIAYFTRFGQSKVNAIDGALSFTREGHPIRNTSERNLVRILKNAMNAAQHVEELKRLNTQLTGHDLKTFESCLLPPLIQVLEHVKEMEPLVGGIDEGLEVSTYSVVIMQCLSSSMGQFGGQMKLRVWPTEVARYSSNCISEQFLSKVFASFGVST